MELVAQGLNFPTSVAIDPAGGIYVVESGLPFDGAPPGGRVLRIQSDGSGACIACGLRAPVNGLTFHEGHLIVSEGGNPGRISRVDPVTGERVTILDGLPGFGNYHTNMAVVGPDGLLYFSQGAMTNSGIIGLDSRDLAWLSDVAHNCDIPGYDITVSGVQVETPDPRNQGTGTASTSAFAPFGTTLAHCRIRGSTPCTASVMRCRPDGANLELVAWGLRNAYGLGFTADGRLLATDQGADLRGSRPVSGCPDFLYEVRPGAWYGWPDFGGGRPLTAESNFVLANHHELPPPERALYEFEVNSCAVRFAVIPRALSNAGDLVVALFGDEKPMTAPQGPRAGRKLVRLSMADWSLYPVSSPALQRPIDVAIAAETLDAYVVDFGAFEMTPGMGVAARRGTGCVWKLSAEFMEV
jgi:hypothetical protein